MNTAAPILIFFTAIVVLLALLVALRAELTRARGGKIPSDRDERPRSERSPSQKHVPQPAVLPLTERSVDARPAICQLGSGEDVLVHSPGESRLDL